MNFSFANFENLEPGEKIIVVDASGQPRGVIMSYDTYSDLRRASRQPADKKELNPDNSADLNLTSDQVLANINDEIAQWKTDHDNPIELEDNLLANAADNVYLESIDE